jgi:hypothetical protein
MNYSEVTSPSRAAGMTNTRSCIRANSRSFFVQDYISSEINNMIPRADGTAHLAVYSGCETAPRHARGHFHLRSTYFHGLPRTNCREPRE